MKKDLNFGSYSRAVSTSSVDAQKFFDKGLMQMFGFNHEDAIRWFVKALEADANLAFAHWGISHSAGLNYNHPGGLSRSIAYEHSMKALQLVQYANEVERALILALSHRYPTKISELCPHTPNRSQRKENKHLERNFANEMRKVFHQFPHDPEVVTIFAESLMNLRPWKLWKPDETGNIPNETYEIKTILETALHDFPLHPCLLHFYIHLMELSPNPESALDVANRLRGLVPDQGHLLHMPSHIDMWLGDYESAIIHNQKAIDADRRYVEYTGIETEFYKMYRLHNIHFCCWACMFDGQYNNALKYARMLQDELTPELLNSEPGVELLEGFYCVVWHIYIRFGSWVDILNEPIPDNHHLYPATISTAHYARGIAHASLGNVEGSEEEEEKFLLSLRNPLLQKRVMINNYIYKGKKGILHVAKFMLRGEIEYRKGNFEIAFSSLRDAVQFNDNLVYDEPWGWMVPPRHALGALLLEQGQITEATDVYRADLKKYSNNLWSLGGLIKCMEQTPTVASSEVQKLKCKLKCASKRADIEISASCFCSTSAGAATPSKPSDSTTASIFLPQSCKAYNI